MVRASIGERRSANKTLEKSQNYDDVIFLAEWEEVKNHKTESFMGTFTMGCQTASRYLSG